MTTQSKRYFSARFGEWNGAARERGIFIKNRKSEYNQNLLSSYSLARDFLIGPFAHNPS
jgi:hypothetical protein